ncbi:transposable element Tcb2 transposase [Trichonephila clavipes]|uniref:Transposable element Tcb2 transposase n=1 Tax=Trichonephila clavipes TaxID=2585209 RepID=A0A8X6SJF3_TRICX|nr:transposable element Tcb2 transposase [Trichonephila clavipes]
MPSRRHIDDFMRGRIIGKIEEGRKITDVAREFDIAHSIVSRLWKSFKTTGMSSRRHGGGRVRRTTPAEDRYIVLSAKKNRYTTAQQVANQFLAASGKQISRKTVARRLRGGGLYACRAVVCFPLTRQHRTARLQWCREHHNWTEQDWACVLFSDESRFSLSSDCRRQLIWRESGTAYRPENIQEKDRYPTCSIMVWVGIMVNGRTGLHVVANGTMTGQRYIDEVLLPHVRLFRGAVGDKFVFMSARSPDLNPIENVWDALGRQVAGRNYPPTNKNTLIRALTEEWDKLPQQLLDNVVQSMELWFQQDGATCHTAHSIIDLLKDTFGDRLISRFGPVNWPPRSCDLTPLDYFLWSYVKSLVSADKPQTLDYLEDNIRRVIADIRPQMLENVIENWTSRLDYIRASRGSPMPEIIFKIYKRAFGDGPRNLLNYGQVTWTTPELALHQREDVRALDRFNVHRFPTRRAFRGTRLEFATKSATIRYLEHSATTATANFHTIGNIRA